MNELVYVEHGKAITDSLLVAEAFGKNHKDVMRDIRNLRNLGCSVDFNERNFAPITYNDGRNRRQTKFLITRDGFTLLAMGYTGKEAMQFKERYIDEFNKMTEQLQHGVAESNDPLPLPEPQPPVKVIPLYDLYQPWRIQLNPHHMSVDIDFPTRDVLLDAVYDIGAIEQGQMMDLFGVRQQHIHSLLNTGELIAHDLYLAGRQMILYTLGLGATGYVGKEPQHIQYWSIEDWLSKLVFFEFVKHMQGELPAFTIQAAKSPFVGSLVCNETEEKHQVLVLQRPMRRFEIPDDNGTPIYVLALKPEYAQQLKQQREQVTVYDFASFMSYEEILPRLVQPHIDPFDFLDKLR